jgi:hypothetical protein
MTTQQHHTLYTTRMTDAERARLERAARMVGVGPRTFARRAIREATDTVLDADATLRAWEQDDGDAA